MSGYISYELLWAADCVAMLDGAKNGEGSRGLRITINFTPKTMYYEDGMF